MKTILLIFFAMVSAAACSYNPAFQAKDLRVIKSELVSTSPRQTDPLRYRLTISNAAEADRYFVVYANAPCEIGQKFAFCACQLQLEAYGE